MVVRGEDVYCTLLMSDSYLPGAAVLARSLRDAGTRKKLAVLVTPDSLLPQTLSELKEIYDYVIPVERIANPSIENLLRLDRLDLRFAFTKIALWRQEQFRKIVYIDADVLALRAPDELFQIEMPFAAAPDIGWPDCFNSGVMVLNPSMSEYWSLQTLASSGTSFDGADQGLLNEYFGPRPWHRLSFTYNCTPSSSYQYEPAYRHFRSSINMVHFIGKDKPWTQGRGSLSSAGSGVYKELLGKWWATYDRHYRTPSSSALGQVSPHIHTVQRYVKGEQTHNAFGWAVQGFQSGPPPAAPPAVPPPTPAQPVMHTPAPNPNRTEFPATDQPLTDSREPGEAIDQGIVEPVPTIEQRKWSAPVNEWDATRAAPPVESRPEAANFPAARYEMSADQGLFKAPKSYPEPPKDMWYRVPETKPAIFQPPKPIFPWESHKRTPSRVFAEDIASPPLTTPSSIVPPPVQQDEQSSFQIQTIDSHKPPLSPPASNPPEPIASSGTPWTSFSRTNAWDEDSSIDAYVRALKESTQRRRAPIQVLSLQQGPRDRSLDSDKVEILSPTSERHRESLILTDFPTEIERPSLPVTPAPITRQSYWSDDKGETEELPAAEGVPEQADWVSKCPRCGFAMPVPSQFKRSSGGRVAGAFFRGGLTASSFKKPSTFIPEGASSPGRRSATPPMSSQSVQQSVVGASTQSSSLNSQNQKLTRGFSFSKDPLERLEELRRSSLVVAEEMEKGQRQPIPQRDIPTSSVANVETRPVSETTLTSAIQNNSTAIDFAPAPSANNNASLPSTGSSSDAVRKIMENQSFQISSSPFVSAAPYMAEKPPTEGQISNVTAGGRGMIPPKLETKSVQASGKDEAGGLFDEYSIA